MPSNYTWTWTYNNYTWTWTEHPHLHLDFSLLPCWTYTPLSTGVGTNTMRVVCLQNELLRLEYCHFHTTCTHTHAFSMNRCKRGADELDTSDSETSATETYKGMLHAYTYEGTLWFYTFCYSYHRAGVEIHFVNYVHRRCHHGHHCSYSRLWTPLLV